jgi:hypothetical protein
MMTFGEIFSDYIRHEVAHPEMRKGQCLFNYLYANEQTRAFANEIRGTDLDPFYNDKVMPEVFAKLLVRMVEAEESA